jgi:hypothetical protein
MGFMSETENAPTPRTPSGTFVRNFWLAFAVFTIATAAMTWSVTAGPWTTDETGAGRGLVLVGSVMVWLIGLTASLSLVGFARKSMTSRKTSLLCSAMAWALALGYLSLVLVDLLPVFHGDRFLGNERNAWVSLKTLVAAEADFRANDRDENKVNDFWVGDVATLYCLKAPGTGYALKLTELSVAAADAAPKGGAKKPIEEFAEPAPKAGYWFKAIPAYVDGSGKRILHDAGDGRNGDRFAFCAFATTRAAGKKTFIVDQQYAVYWKDTNNVPVDTFPADPAKEGWTKIE